MKKILFLGGVFALLILLLCEAKKNRKACHDKGGLVVRGTCVK